MHIYTPPKKNGTNWTDFAWPNCCVCVHEMLRQICIDRRQMIEVTRFLALLEPLEPLIVESAWFRL